MEKTNQGITNQNKTKNQIYYENEPLQMANIMIKQNETKKAKMKHNIVKLTWTLKNTKDIVSIIKGYAHSTDMQMYLKFEFLNINVT